MPRYEYQCECGVKFDAYKPMSQHSSPQPCPSCQAMAARIMPSDVQGVFNQEVSGPVPQNTGLASLDEHIDRVIGQSAAQGRMVHSQRVEVKRELLRDNPGATGYDITKLPDGSFDIMSEKDRKAHDKAKKINSMAMKAIEQDKAIRASS